MIKINPVKNLDRFKPRSMKEYAAKEVLAAAEFGKVVVTASEVAYALELEGEEVIVFGVLPRSMLGAPNLVWLLALKKLSVRHAREVRKMFIGLTCIYGSLRAKVEAAHPMANRFAKFLGMKAVGMDGIYRVYEVNKWHS